MIEGGRCGSEVPFIYQVDGKYEGIDNIAQLLNNRSLNSLLPVSVIINGRTGNPHAIGLLFDNRDRVFVSFDASHTQENEEYMQPLYQEVETNTGYRFRPIPCYRTYQELTRDFFCALWVLMVMYIVCTTGMDITQVLATLDTYDADRLKAEIEGFINFVYLQMDRLGLLQECLTSIRIAGCSTVPIKALSMKPEPLDYLRS